MRGTVYRGAVYVDLHMKFVFVFKLRPGKSRDPINRGMVNRVLLHLALMNAICFLGTSILNSNNSKMKVAHVACIKFTEVKNRSTGV